MTDIQIPNTAFFRKRARLNAARGLLGSAMKNSRGAPFKHAARLLPRGTKRKLKGELRTIGLSAVLIRSKDGDFYYITSMNGATV